MGHARKERVGLFGTDQRITSGPAAKRPHSKAEYMTAPERFADSQIPYLHPNCDMGWIEMPQRGSHPSYRGVLSFLSKAREASGSEPARVHHAARRRGCDMAAGRTCTATEPNAARWRVSWINCKRR